MSEVSKGLLDVMAQAPAEAMGLFSVLGGPFRANCRVQRPKSSPSAASEVTGRTGTEDANGQYLARADQRVL